MSQPEIIRMGPLLVHESFAQLLVQKKAARNKSEKSWTIPQVTRGGGAQIVCGIPKKQEF